MSRFRSSCLAVVLSALQFSQVALAQAPFNPGFNQTWNRNYFGFPALVDWIPIFKVGDVINATWSADYVGYNSINVWCGTPTIYLIQTFNSLDQNGHALIPVLDSWVDPCHLNLVVSDGDNNEIGGFNSGAFNINNKTKANATPTTWAALGPSGAASSYTGGSFSATTATAAVTHRSTTVGATENTACAQAVSAGTSSQPAGANGSTGTGSSGGGGGLSFGAGVGVGIAIMAGVTLVAGLAAWLLLKRRMAKAGTVTNINPNMEKYAGRPPAELADVPARAEMPAESYR